MQEIMVIGLIAIFWTIIFGILGICYYMDGMKMPKWYHRLLHKLNIYPYHKCEYITAAYYKHNGYYCKICGEFDIPPLRPLRKAMSSADGEYYAGSLIWINQPGYNQYRYYPIIDFHNIAHADENYQQVYDILNDHRYRFNFYN